MKVMKNIRGAQHFLHMEDAGSELERGGFDCVRLPLRAAQHTPPGSG